MVELLQDTHGKIGNFGEVLNRVKPIIQEVKTMSLKTMLTRAPVQISDYQIDDINIISELIEPLLQSIVQFVRETGPLNMIGLKSVKIMVNSVSTHLTSLLVHVKNIRRLFPIEDDEGSDKTSPTGVLHGLFTQLHEKTPMIARLLQKMRSELDNVITTIGVDPDVGSDDDTETLDSSDNDEDKENEPPQKMQRLVAPEDEQE